MPETTSAKTVGGIYKNIVVSVLGASLRLCQRFGFHIARNNYYQPIPDTSELKNELWTKQSELVGIDINEANQLSLLSRFSGAFRQEYERLPREKTSLPHAYYIDNGAFESVDAEIFYCMIRGFRPRRIFEVGSGNSTYLAAQAVLKNKEESGDECELVAIEPNPTTVLRRGFPGLSGLVPAKVEDVPLSEFCRLEANDILFIDSSHVLRIGNDVQYEFLEVLPRLSKGVIVHIHDIFLPAEYPKAWVVRQHRFWTEQYLLQAFLAFNESFEVLWAGSYMHLKHADELEAAFSSYKRDETWPGSFWIRKTKTTPRGG